MKIPKDVIVGIGILVLLLISLQFICNSVVKDQLSNGGLKLLVEDVWKPVDTSKGEK